MDDIRDRVREWDSKSVEGADGMARLADREFTGALVEDDDVLFLLNGRVVGTTGKPADAFDGGRAHQAPGAALPLLFSMVEDGSTKTRGYTNDTSLQEVDETLQESKFTGYVELSENVLSGDYYLVYYGGRALYAAFVGAQNETVTGDEAFERAADEVGIYEVIDASVDVSDLPTPEEPEATDGEASEGDSSDDDSPDSDASESGTAVGAVTIDGGDGADGSDDGSAAPTDDGERSAEVAADDTEHSEQNPTPSGEAGTTETDGADEATTDPDGENTSEQQHEQQNVDVKRSQDANRSGSEATGVSVGQSDGRDTGETNGGETDSGGDASVSDDAAEGATAKREENPSSDSAANDDGVVADRNGRSEGHPSGGAESEAERESPGRETAESRRTDPRGGPVESDGTRADGQRRPAGATDEGVPAEPERDAVFDAEEEWRETTAIPALDPDDTADGGSGSEDDPADPERRSRSKRTSQERGQDIRETLRERTAALEEQRSRLETADRRVEELEADLETARSEQNDLEARVEELEAEREELNETVAKLRTERDNLESRVEELETELAEARAAESDGPDGESIAAERALAGTNLFVRYDSKGDPTLDAVTEGASREEVRTNLRLDEHTTFDAEGATVEGEPFEAFLRGSPEYEFVEWAVTELPFEIRETGHESGLAELYAALPNVDRAELHGSVEVETEDGATETHDFDVVLRDRMGEALVVAEINAGRDPVTGPMMGELVDAATAVAAGTDIGAALYVTASFFEPDALETAESNAGGGLLSRSSKENYVRVERKRGYHLCLAESRDGSFYVTVPEL